MLFARSALLDDLGVVVLDEVHYLQDPYRGSVWEEVLVLTPPGVSFVSLSATVNNAGDFGRWLTSVRGTTRVVVETHRPVTLHHHYAVAERGRDGMSVLPLLRDGAAQPRRAPARRPPQALVPPALPVTPADRGGRVPGRRRACCPPSPSSSRGPPATTPPARCVQDGVRLTTDDERARIRALVEDSVERLSDADLRTLGYGPWSDALEAGVAPHHAGLVPAFRQAVERCFSRGAAEGGVRHRDPGPRDQHAGPHRGGRAVRQVPGLGHLGPDLGRVPAADRSGGPAGHRHRGPRLRAVEPGHHLRPGGPHGGGAAAGPGVLVPPDLQPGRQPGPPVDPRGGPRPARVLLRAVAGPRGLRVAGGPAGPAPGHPRRPGLPRRVGADRRRAPAWPGSTTSRTCWWPRCCGPGCSTASSRPTWPGWPRR